MKEKFILDTDIGSDADDAVALLYLLKNKSNNLEAVTTVYGKTRLRAKIARKMINCSREHDIPVYSGIGRPISSPYGVWHTEIEGEGVLSKDEKVEDINNIPGIYTQAPKFIIDYFKRNRNDASIITIGPLTNLAQAYLDEPRLSRWIKHHYLMGGNYKGLTEHNIDCDIGAAQIVFDTNTPKTIIPTNVTKKVKFYRKEFAFLKKRGLLERLTYNQIDKWFEYINHESDSTFDSICMHDPLTVFAFHNPDLVETFSTGVTISEEGNFHTNDNSRKKFNIAYKVDANRFKMHLLSVLSKVPRKEQ